jgi:peptide deformylase
MQLITYPNEILTTPSVKIEEITPEIVKLSNEMHDFMVKSGGVGLAAPQVGLNIRMFVVNLMDGVNKYTIINPVFLERNGSCYMMEGCLSFPGKFANVKRDKNCIISYTNLLGEQCTLKCDKLLARVVLHEIEHLEGEIFIK